jgi:hypothetical protein
MNIRAYPWIAGAVTLALLLFGLWLYSRPDMAVLLAEQLWACF